MKKFFAILAIAGTLVACNDNANGEGAADSAAVGADTTMVMPMDTTMSMPMDSATGTMMDTTGAAVSSDSAAQ